MRKDGGDGSKPLRLDDAQQSHVAREPHSARRVFQGGGDATEEHGSLGHVKDKLFKKSVKRGEEKARTTTLSPEICDISIFFF